MTDPATNQPAHVTADERPHPALQKLARACITLARLRLEHAREHSEESRDVAVSAPVGDDPEVRHG